MRAIKATAFDPTTGTLTWTAEDGRRLRKRGTLALNKWIGLDERGEQTVRGLRIFIAPPPEAGSAAGPAAAALARFCRVGAIDGPISALVEVELRADGTLAKLRTPTFQAAARAPTMGRTSTHARAHTW